MSDLPAAPTPWSDAMLAASLLAIDPHGLGGIRLRSRAGVVRDRWLDVALGLLGDATPRVRIAAGIPEQRLTGGLDLGLTLESGRPVVERGVLARADGGVVVLAMAERLPVSAAALVGLAMDRREVSIERDGLSAVQPARFAVIALDEGIEEERLAAPLADRLGLCADLDGVALRETDGPQPADCRGARKRLPQVSISDRLVEALCGVATSAGVQSMRCVLHLVRAARAAAALRGASAVEMEDAASALRLVLGLRHAEPPEEAASGGPEEQVQPETPPERRESETPESSDDRREMPSAEALRDMLVQAVAGTLPKHLLDGADSTRPQGRSRGEAGRVGPELKGARRGRAIGTTDRPPIPGARPDVLATLRQAAPWQRLRAGSAKEPTAGVPGRLRVRKSDFRYLRLRQKSGATAVFAVDASGSAALERLAETKGAVELLLAECYVRRDQVAMIAFRGKGAEVLLEPTRSLVRAKRCLSALPGGGGTPLAGGILATLAMTTAARRDGHGAIAVFLTDGRGNVGLDGGTDRARVAADTQKAARAFRAAGHRAILIDTAQRPQPRAESLARELGAEYLALPRGGAGAMAREIGARMEE